MVRWDVWVWISWVNENVEKKLQLNEILNAWLCEVENEWSYIKSSRDARSWNSLEVKVWLRHRTHGVKKVPESHKFDSNLAQNPLSWFKFVGPGHFFDSLCTIHKPSFYFQFQDLKSHERVKKSAAFWKKVKNKASFLFSRGLMGMNKQQTIDLGAFEKKAKRNQGSIQRILSPDQTHANADKIWLLIW